MRLEHGKALHSQLALRLCESATTGGVLLSRAMVVSSTWMRRRCMWNGAITKVLPEKTGH
jgi:hypothetical protein